MHAGAVGCVKFMLGHFGDFRILSRRDTLSVLDSGGRVGYWVVDGNVTLIVDVTCLKLL